MTLLFPQNMIFSGSEKNQDSESQYVILEVLLSTNHLVAKICF